MVSLFAIEKVRKGRGGLLLLSVIFEIATVIHKRFQYSLLARLTSF